MPTLRIIEGFGAGFALELSGARITIGRDPTCSLQIGDTKASRTHAALERKSDSYRLRDLGSSNGTWQGDEKVSIVRLKHGDCFRIGSTVMRYEEQAMSSEEEALDWGATIAGLESEVGSLLKPAANAEALARQNEYLVLLHEVVKRCHEADSREELFEVLDDVAADALEGDRCAVFLPDADGWKLWPPHERRLRARFGATPFARTLLAEAQRRRAPLLCTDEGDIDPSASMALAGTRSAMAAPLRLGDQVHALLYVDRLDGEEPFTRNDLEFLEAVANQLAVRLANHDQVRELEAKVERLSQEPPTESVTIIGRDPAIDSVRSFIDKAAPTTAPVLVLGESGTGKELVARAIHLGSARASRPLQVVHCAAIAEGLVEATLFGQARGAVGGEEARPGLVELADQGTLFLDEVGDLPAAAQARFLRLLETGEVQRLGDQGQRRVDVRLVVASNRDLAAEAAAGRFRDDLLQRLEVLQVTLPPLRERPGDIDLLLDHFLAESARRLDQPLRRLSPEARTALLRYHWPGNVRQLRNTLERALIMASSETVGVDDLPETVHERAQPTFITPICPLAEVERHHILHVLDHCGGNKKAAAETLGIDRSTLYAKLRQYGAHA